ncbi:hypothetical protein DSL92_04600 [Billgrantia gudaonensis]|uniref:Serine aminopeptidase S33 domain-containing protein n=1 Tax=Billgrantia gudaonensis TaxID=376427 RepID=A0A3S0NEX2_9GAMM|nr:hypothetical protein DSL92_04600 [Halomonas gudaonensis]
MRHWPAAGERRAVVPGGHNGFNDHGGSFAVFAEALTQAGIIIHAHDQRGFGTTAQRRYLAGPRAPGPRRDDAARPAVA